MVSRELRFEIQSRPPFLQVTVVEKLSSKLRGVGGNRKRNVMFVFVPVRTVKFMSVYFFQLEMLLLLSSP